MKILWDKVREANANKEGTGEAHLSKTDLDKKQENMEGKFGRKVTIILISS